MLQNNAWSAYRDDNDETRKRVYGRGVSARDYVLQVYGS
jgi:hypothetical protein